MRSRSNGARWCTAGAAVSVVAQCRTSSARLAGAPADSKADTRNIAATSLTSWNNCLHTWNSVSSAAQPVQGKAGYWKYSSNRGRRYSTWSNWLNIAGRCLAICRTSHSRHRKCSRRDCGTPCAILMPGNRFSSKRKAEKSAGSPCPMRYWNESALRPVLSSRPRCRRVSACCSRNTPTF